MTNLEVNRNIADFIGSYCSKWNISVSKFADKCGIPYMTLKRIIACNVQKIDVYTIVCIAEATKTPIMEILEVNHENLDLYKRISYITPHDRLVLTYLLNTLEKLHISGSECREIPYALLKSDKKGYLFDSPPFSEDRLDFSKMERITFRSSFSEGFLYFGFQLPDNRLYPYFYKDTILLAVNDDPAEGEIGAFAWKDEGFIRLIFRRVHFKDRFMELLPIAGRGRKYSIDTENVSDLMKWVPLGVVVGIIR